MKKFADLAPVRHAGSGLLLIAMAAPAAAATAPRWRGTPRVAEIPKPVTGDRLYKIPNGASTYGARIPTPGRIGAWLLLYLTAITSAGACLLLPGAAQAAPLISHFPEHGVGQFLAERFDLASIRSSIGPRRTMAQRTFSDLGMKPTQATDDALIFDSPGDWFYALKIVGRGDVNRDGIEDLEICFIDRSLNGGSYNNAQGLLVTRYTPDGYAVALSFSRDRACPESAR
ncbi:hypothetical protein ABT364_22565 [Massilia sp. SR12]